MAKNILIHCGIAETSIALVSDGILERYWSELSLSDEGGPAAGASRVGEIVLARVKRVLPALNAAFVDIGDERDGFLAARDAGVRMGARKDDGAAISELVHEGERLLVQVLRDAMDDKGARVGVALTIPGRYLVLTPQGGRVTLSRRIEDEGERARLTEILARLAAGGGATGFVVRTAAIGASEAELQDDVEYLRGLWSEIELAAEEAEPPATLHSEPDLIERVLRDHMGDAIGRVVAGDRRALNAARDYAREAMPEFVERIVLHEKPSPLFAEFGIDDSVAALSEPIVALPSGGWIIIERTAAMTAIDVNSGRQVSRGDLDATARLADSEAAEEIARQIVLRSIGGLVAIDFIPLGGDAAYAALAARLKQRLKDFGVAAEVSHMPGMNLVAATIKRMRASLDSRARESCAECDGHGQRVSVEAAALDALRAVERTAAAAPGAPIAMRVGAEIASWLEAHSAALKAEFARRGVTALRVYPEKTRGRTDYSVETVNPEAGD